MNRHKLAGLLAVAVMLPLPSGVALAAYHSDSDTGVSVLDYIEDRHCSERENRLSDEQKAELTKRLNRLIGQLGGIRKMIEDDRYCGDVLIQISAAEKALDSLGMAVMKSHLESCVADELQSGNTEVIGEVMELFKRLH